MLVMTGLAIVCGLSIALPRALNEALVGLVWIAATGWLVTGLFFRARRSKSILHWSCGGGLLDVEPHRRSFLARHISIICPLWRWLNAVDYCLVQPRTNRRGCVRQRQAMHPGPTLLRAALIVVMD